MTNKERIINIVKKVCACPYCGGHKSNPEDPINLSKLYIHMIEEHVAELYVERLKRTALQILDSYADRLPNGPHFGEDK